MDSPNAAPASASSASADNPEDNALDVALMRRVGAGEEMAFAVLVERHQSRVIGTVSRMLGADAAADAEDIAQQVFIRVWRSAARYEATAKFTTWLFTITRNLVFNELRRRKSRPTVSLDGLADPTGEAGGRPRESADPTAPAPDARLREAEVALAIDAAIAQLPETQRLALILRRYEDLPYEEIARVLGLTIPAVKSLLFRARNDLRTRLAGFLEG